MSSPGGDQLLPLGPRPYKACRLGDVGEETVLARFILVFCGRGPTVPGLIPVTGKGRSVEEWLLQLGVSKLGIVSVVLVNSAFMLKSGDGNGVCQLLYS